MTGTMEHEWELNRENIRPLRSGRKVKSINSIFGGSKITMVEAEKRFEDDFERAKASDKPLDICLEYIIWFEEHFPTGKQSHLFAMLTRIINAFGYREEFLNDEKMLKFWIKLIENKSDANIDAFFERAYLAGCCRRLAKFYVRWAEARESSNDINGARTVLKRGREQYAEPLNLLNEASDALEMRQIRAFQNLNDSETDLFYETEFNIQRLALGQLTGLGPNQEAPVFRDASKMPGSLRTGIRRQLANEMKGNGFQIYQGNEVFDDENLLVPKSFGDDLAHVAFAQNSWNPTKWNDARIRGIPKRNEMHSAAFTVFNEDDGEVKEVKQRNKRSRLRILNKVISMEELFAEQLQL
uniref:BUB1 N-terminal domain-containing protein n=1 Tax=Setaria digitata TaxID=48799 RepID=A0A915PG64_9BILA